ncbi:hypothetical protein [Pararhizobium mangrovi]|uniref:Uncharacterized protein n=1 Tax=Pararhizobium mangrovi TaxID=2590452 RepID=A0A506U066_9HYPH|nr:hypothetical protein [Pararhizobium mangrovi]TPW26848.1 hypothetical protein FJU11_13665 [Pararhizobium mangrovi]
MICPISEAAGRAARDAARETVAHEPDFRVTGEMKTREGLSIPRHYIASAVLIGSILMLGAMVLAHAGIERHAAYETAEARV